MRNLIVAISKNDGIGYKNNLPWKLKPDLMRFKNLTLNSNVIMGRKTFDSLPFSSGLPSRHNIILTRNTCDLDKRISKMNIPTNTRITVTRNLIPANYLNGDVWFIGGAELYKKVIEEKIVDSMYITRIHTDFECDTFLNIDYSNFSKADESERMTYNEIEYSYELWQANRS
jgi:dihydrofolate reductase